MVLFIHAGSVACMWCIYLFVASLMNCCPSSTSSRPRVHVCGVNGWMGCVCVCVCGNRCSDFMAIESVLPPGLQRCANTTYVTTMRKPFQRILSHIEFEHLKLAQVAEWLNGEAKPPHNVYVKQVHP